MKKHEHEYKEWEFVPAFPHHPGEHGLPEDFEQHPEDIKIESICGGIDESQPVEQYDGTLGVTRAFVDAHQAPVGQIQWNGNLAAIYTNPGNVSGVRWCSGTLITCNLFLTAGHCFDSTGGGWNRPLVNGTNTPIPPAEIAQNMHVNFNYQVDPNGNLRQEREFAILELVEYRNNGVDYAIVRLEGNPGAEFGFTNVASADGNDDDVLCIIGHPTGLPKRIEAGTLFHLHDTRLGYDDIDTLGGSSGSGVLGPNGTIVGVHTNGGCDAAAIGHNHGQRISSIIAASPTIADLIANKQKFMDDGCRFRFKLPAADIARVRKPVGDDTVVKLFTDGARKSKVLDDYKLKHVDDVKGAGYDLRPSLGAFRNQIFGGLPLRGGVPSNRNPFILSTPHHSEYLSGGERPGAPGGGESVNSIPEYEARLSEIEHAVAEVMRELAELQTSYQRWLTKSSEALQARGTRKGQ